MSDPQNSTPNAKELVTQLNEFMQRCEELLDQNIEPDMEGMDKQVANLQDMIADLPFDQLAQMQPLLQGLMDQLLTLENRLKAERDTVRDSLQSVNQKKQAHNAYQRIQSSTNPDTDTNASNSKDTDNNT